MSETVTHLSRRCSRCGRQLPPDAPEGLCASCLLTAGAETLTGSSEPSATGDTSLPGAPRLVDGQLWGPYRVIRLLGRGGMGEVYEAEQLETGRRLALKVLRDSSSDPSARLRLVREARIAAGVSHPLICQVFELGEWNNQPFIAMELIDGEPLSSWMRSHRNARRAAERSEERRVGKECLTQCRSRWSPYH